MNDNPASGVRGRPRLAHEARRQLIIETTLACLARHGANGTTLRQVCREMRVAPSLVTHFFVGWHDLLVAAYDLLAERFLAQLTPILEREVADARRRMDAVIRCYIATDAEGGNSMGAHIALWQFSRTVPELRACFTRFLADRQRVLRGALVAVAEAAGATIQPDEMTACFILMMDGIWLEMSLNPGNITPDRAREMCWSWIDAVVGRQSLEGQLTTDN